MKMMTLILGILFIVAATYGKKISPILAPFSIIFFCVGFIMVIVGVSTFQNVQSSFTNVQKPAIEEEHKE